MSCPLFCWQCYLDLRPDQWNTLMTRGQWQILQCPRCRAIYSLNPSGQIWLSQRPLKERKR